MGLADYLGWDFRPVAGIPIVNVPGCPVQPDNFMETLTWLLYQAAGLSPMIPLDDQLRPTWLFGKTVHEGCDRAGYYEQGDFARRLQLAQVHREARLLGTGGQLQRDQARLDGRARGLSRTWAASASGARCPASPTSSCRSWMSPRAASSPRRMTGVYGPMIRTLRSITNYHGQQRTQVAAQPRGANDRLRPAVAGVRRGSISGYPRGSYSGIQEPRGDVVGPDHPHRR